jgi:hypothetical protein
MAGITWDDGFVTTFLFNRTRYLEFGLAQDMLIGILWSSIRWLQATSSCRPLHVNAYNGSQIHILITVHVHLLYVAAVVVIEPCVFILVL